VEDLEKRIEELKAVQFWLDQNAVALKATIQALEVQKMTLATLKGMNFSMGDVANALKLKTADTLMSGLYKAGDTVAGAASSVSGTVQRATGTAPAAQEEPVPPVQLLRHGHARGTRLRPDGPQSRRRGVRQGVGRTRGAFGGLRCRAHRGPVLRGRQPLA
jgi:hypothetical protein